MGMDMENVLARPFTAVNRNSDDFFPNRERGFISHIIQNVYSAIWHDQMYYCDFDMWWSMHESAVQSGVLRAISGSPVYVSDKIGESNAANIAPVVAGEDAGYAYICIEDKCVGKVPLVYESTVEIKQPEKKHFWDGWFGGKK